MKPDFPIDATCLYRYALCSNCLRLTLRQDGNDGVCYGCAGETCNLDCCQYCLDTALQLLAGIRGQVRGASVVVPSWCVVRGVYSEHPSVAWNCACRSGIYGSMCFDERYDLPGNPHKPYPKGCAFDGH